MVVVAIISLHFLFEGVILFDESENEHWLQVVMDSTNWKIVSFVKFQDFTHSFIQSLESNQVSHVPYRPMYQDLKSEIVSINPLR